VVAWEFAVGSLPFTVELVIRTPDLRKLTPDGKFDASFILASGIRRGECAALPGRSWARRGYEIQTSCFRGRIRM